MRTGRRAKVGRRSLVNPRHGLYKRRRGIYRYGGYKGMGSIYGSVPKFNDLKDTLTITGEAGNGADSLDNVSDIDIGTGPTDRNAQCVAIKSLYIEFSCNMPNFSDATMTTSEAVVVMPQVNYVVLILLDRQPNKAALVAANIWEDPTDFNSPLNLDNRKRIKVMKKYKGSMNLAAYTKFSNTSAGVNEVVRGLIKQHRKCYMKFSKPIKVEYDTAAVTGVVGDIVDNAISVWYMTDRYLASTILPTMNLFCRTRFVSC